MRRQLLELHPDRTGGTFPTKESETRYHRISEALRYIEFRVPVPLELAGIAKHLESLDQALALIARVGPGSVDGSEGRKSRDDIKSDASARYRTSRLRTTAFATAAATIVGFSQILTDNPLFGWVAQNTTALIALGLLFAGFGGLAVMNWIREQKVQRIAMWLLGEEGLGYIVKQCLEYTSRDESEAVITRRGLTQQVLWFQRPWDKRPWLKRLKQYIVGGIPVAVAEHIADMQIAELLRRGVVRQDGFRGI